jgi:hypothetical protein
MDVDEYGTCFLNCDLVNSNVYLWILNQEIFPIDLKQLRGCASHVIARSFALSYYDGVSSQKPWEPVLRKALQLGLCLTPKSPGTNTTLEYLFCFNGSQESFFLAQEWLSLLASVGLHVDDYIREEKRIHDSGFLLPKYKSARERRLIFEETGSPTRQSIRWEWFYHHEDPAYHVLAEFSAFGDIHPRLPSVWQDKWPFFDIETLKTRSEIEAKRTILQARWAKQAARRQRRSEYSPCFKKPSKSERRIRVPGAWVEDDLPISFKWPRIRILRFPWWLYLFTLGVAFLMSGPNFRFIRGFLGAEVRV